MPLHCYKEADRTPYFCSRVAREAPSQLLVPSLGDDSVAGVFLDSLSYNTVANYQSAIATIVEANKIDNNRPSMLALRQLLDASMPHYR